MKLQRWLAPLLVLMVGLAGCTGNGEAPEEENLPLVSQSINPVPTDEMSEGGELRIAVPSLGETFNPLHSGAPGGGNDTSAYLPSFFHYNEAGVADPNPDFVSSIEATGTPTVVTITLNPKATWGDGDPLSWQDLAATVQACNGSNPEYRCATNRFEAIEKVERGVDDQQIVVTFKRAEPDWPNAFRGVSTLRAESVARPEQFNNEWQVPRSAWLSGPFTFDRYDEASKTVTWVPNPKWWGERPMLQRLTYRQVSPDATAAAYLNNQVDVFTIGIDPDGQRRAQGAADGDVRIAASADSRELVFNTRSGPLSDPQVRRAIVAALDRNQIARTDLEGIDWSPRALNSHLWVENQPEYADMVKQTGLGYDPDRARTILDEAGWVAAEDGSRSKDGQKLTVSFTTVKGMKASELEGQQIHKMLGDIGIEVTFTEVELAAYTSEEVMTSGNFQILAVTEPGNPAPFVGITERFAADAPSNWSGWSSPELQQLTEQIAVEADHDRRVELGRQADALLWEAAPSLPLYQLPESVATKRNVANYGAFGLGTPVWTEVGFTGTS